MSRRLIARARETGRIRRTPAIAVALGLVVAASACTLPKVPPYPYWGPYGSRQGVIDEANRRSAALEQYVKDVLDGKKPALIPANVLPDGYDKSITNIKVLRESEIDPAKQWIIRQAKPIDWNNSPGLYPEPQATYLLMPNMAAPFGSKAIVTGAFPRARFFAIQNTESFQPELYHAKFGIGEVPIVDADINPSAGSTNPFRVGANRNATNREFEVTIESRVGNSYQLTDAHKPEKDFRAPGNTRPGSGLRYRGPWGDPNYQDGSPLVDHGGLWTFGEIWIRYFAPDTAAGPMGGVRLPKVTYQLPDGRRYFIQGDLTTLANSMNAAEPIQQETANDPATGKCGPAYGWGKNWGILRNGLARGQEMLNNGTFDPKYVRDTEKGAAGKAEDLPRPASNESTESLTPYNHYFGRCMSVQPGKVAVLTGRKPTTPKTKAGQATMTAAQARFWSITTYDDYLDPFNTGRPFGQPITYVGDEDVITDANGYYTIVYSSAADRPANATAANGVTWVNWGPKGNSGFFMRWQCVGPEWTSDKCPDEVRLGRKTDEASPQYDPNVIGRNNRNGFWGDYQPITSYMTKTQFQNLGTNVKWNQIPVWK